MVTPLKMKYSGTMAPKGVPSGKGSSTPAKVMKGARSAGEMYKKPATGTLKGKNAKDNSSGQSNPSKQSASDKVRYTQAKQPVQFSNADRPAGACKFVC